MLKENKNLDLKIEHLILNVKDLNRTKEFYTFLFVEKLNCIIEIDELDLFAVKFPNGFLLEFKKLSNNANNQNFNKNSIGMHHFGIYLNCKTKVDELFNCLLEKGVEILDKPTFYPEYLENYYAFYYLDPNGFKMEFCSY
jgi:catechol 2,3-dioxygenase-like lactoylglutathione lyase family enzyme